MQRIEKLLEKARALYDNGDPGHDFHHIRRVVATCKALARFEAADLEVLLPAAILHDVVNLPKNHPERLQASQMAAARAKEILRQCEFRDDEIARITQLITEHSYSLGQNPTSIESALLQDADKLDALGAIGIMRTVSCGARLGSVYYSGEEPIPATRPLDDKAFTVDHFYNKLFKLPALMNTAAARAEAERRVLFMRQFLNQLRDEIEPAL